MEETEEAIWSSCNMGGGLYEELAVGDIHVFPMEISTFDEIQTRPHVQAWLNWSERGTVNT